MKPAWLEVLRAALANTPLQTDSDILAAYSRDQAPLAPAGTAAALVHARSIDDVVATLRVADAHRIPVVTRGAGTGLAGGANALDGCIVLSVAKMNRIVRIDTETRTAVVEPGVINAHLAREAATRGLYYAPDPASRDISTIGGNISTNAGGACCLKYGVTGDHVAALKLVLAGGDIIRTGSLAQKNVAGFDLNRLIVGSEGTLGVVVEATMRLRRRPRPASTLVAFFDSMQSAAAAIVAMEASDDLSLIEIMDRVTLTAVERMANMGLDTSAAAIVIVQSDGVDATTAMARCQTECERHGGRDIVRTDDPEEGKMMLAARRLALHAMEKLGTTLLDDVAVPKPALPAMFACIEAAAAAHGLVIGTFGHAGDGNLHPTIVFDGTDAGSRVRAQSAFDDIVRAAVELGGTVSGEHGIGSLKQPYLSRMLGERERALSLRIKAAFDPRGILNPGKAI